MLKTFLITTAAVALFAATAHATILFSQGNSPTGSEQNVMFESGATTPALSVTGDTNQTNTPVTFSTLTGQMIRAQGIGQANIVCDSGCFNAGSNNTNMQLTSLDMKMGTGFGATDIVANPDFGEGTMQVAVTNQMGATFFFVLTKGNNFFTLTASDGEVITDVQMTQAASNVGNFGWNDFKQPRVSGVCTLVDTTCTQIPIPPMPATPPGLADTAVPGSVLVFPKFAQGLITLDNGSIEPNTQIEIAAVCPASGATNSPQTCDQQNAVYEVEVHWVCPGITVGQNTSVCPESDFQVFVSTYGKVVFNPDGAPSGITANGRLTGFPALNGTSPVPRAPCARGYAIAYVVDSQLRPLADNVLIGDAVRRNSVTTLTNDNLHSYSALAIQANGDFGSLVATAADPVTGGAALPFNGAADGYQMVTGQFYGDVRYQQDATIMPGDKAPFADTAIIFLTLNVRSNLPNVSTFVNLNFYNQKEIPVSTHWQFDCWDQVQLAGPAGTKFIDANLTADAMGTPNGVVVSGQAFDVTTGAARTLLALIETAEGPTSGTAASTRSYTVRPSNNSVPVPTIFVYN